VKFSQVYFVVDDSFRLLWIGGEWDESALANGGSDARSNEVLSTSLFEHIVDEPTRRATQAMAEAVQDTHQALRIDYRCDSPTLKRRYLMTIQPMKDNRVLFVHDLRDVQSFPTSFSPWRHEVGVPELKCSFCCSVRLPDTDWTPPEALAAPHPEVVDFTLCPNCEARITEAVAALRDGRKPGLSTTGGYGPDGELT
jgi:hypothetical protein